MLLTVMKPDAKPHPVTGLYKLSDFVAVSHLDVRGFWSMKDLVPVQQLATLARWVNEVEKREKDERGRRRHGRVR